jgi:hypothetical protein
MKEFDGFVEQWEKDQTVTCVQNWIVSHSRSVERSWLEVYVDLLSMALPHYDERVRRADSARFEGEQSKLVSQAASLLALLQCLTFDLGELHKAQKQIGGRELERLFQTIAAMVDSKSPVHAQFQPENEAFLVRIAHDWQPDMTPLVRQLHAFDYSFARYFQGPVSRALRDQLCSVVLPRFGKQIIGRFREPGFGISVFSEEKETHEVRRMLLDVNSALWKELRSDALAVFAEASSSLAIQENAYELLHLTDYKLHEQGNAEEQSQIMALVSDKEIVDALWAAATATQLSPNATWGLHRFAKKIGKLKLPPWWEDNLRAIMGAAAKIDLADAEMEPPDQGNQADGGSPSEAQ